MTDSLTILRARHRRLAKLIRPDGTCEGYDLTRTVDLIPHPVADLAALHRLLLRLHSRRDCAVIRGEPISGSRLRVRRLLHDDPQTGEAATVRDVARRWLALDVDSLEAPEGLDLYDLAACARVALAALPEAFHGAAVLAQATASHTIKPGLRLRLWTWLARPMTGGALKRWLAAAPVDASVFGAVQPIYTAAPLFMGCADPLAVRVAWLPGQDAVVPPPEADLAPPPRRPTPLPTLRPGYSGRYARRALEGAVGRILAASARHPAILSEARGLGRLVAAGVLPEADMRNTLHAAARAVGKDDPDEINKIMAWALLHRSGNRLEARHG